MPILVSFIQESFLELIYISGAQIKNAIRKLLSYPLKFLEFVESASKHGFSSHDTANTEVRGVGLGLLDY